MLLETVENARRRPERMNPERTAVTWVLVTARDMIPPSDAQYHVSESPPLHQCRHEHNQKLFLCTTMSNMKLLITVETEPFRAALVLFRRREATNRNGRRRS